MPVLVVDNSHSRLRALEELLANWKMKPGTAETGEEALGSLEAAFAADEPVRLMVVDADLSGMDGMALVKLVRERWPARAPATILAAPARLSGDLVKAVKGQRDLKLISKPIRHSQLFDTIVDALTGDAPVSAGAGRRPATGGNRLPPQRVLLAEDNVVNQRVAVALLRREGHDVVVAENGRQALEKLEGGRFDLVLMDIQMPEMSGLEAALKIRERERVTGGHLPIIALTAHAMKGDEEQCLEAGMDGYVSKPILPGALFRAMEAVLPEHASLGGTGR
jgi:CheY-like chemotaxis protein